MKRHVRRHRHLFIALLSVTMVSIGMGTAMVVADPGGGDQVAQAETPVARDLSPEATDEELSQLVTDNNTFAMNLYQVLRQSSSDDLFFSPYSISQALAMTIAGARETTEEQMQQALVFSLGQERLHPVFNRLDLLLASRADIVQTEREHGTPFQLNVANAIWPHLRFTLLPGFTELLERQYGIETHTLDYEQTEEARQTINAWVADRTAQRIQELIPAGILTNDTRLVLTNAIYFIAGWQNRFPVGATAEDVFTLLDGSEATSPFMHQHHEMRYHQGEDVEAVQLPYYGNQLSMLVIIPTAGTFEAFDAGLTVEVLDGIRHHLRSGTVDLSLPKFRVESGFSLNDALTTLGMPIAFSASDANFTGMAEIRTPEDNLYISAVLHKAFLEINEEGTEAAAATAVVMARAGSAYNPDPPQPIVIEADRPFIVVIQDDETGAILFLGRVLDPR